MIFIPAWRNFKRMQDITVAAACLIYAGAAVHAIGRLPGDLGSTLRWILLYPAGYLLASFFLPLVVTPVKAWLGRYVWMSFKAGFGQTPVSIITGMLLLMGAGGFIYWQVARAADVGQVGANVFSAYAAGIGILGAQAVLVRVLEGVPEIRQAIVERGGS